MFSHIHWDLNPSLLLVRKRLNQLNDGYTSIAPTLIIPNTWIGKGRGVVNFSFRNNLKLLHQQF